MPPAPHMPRRKFLRGLGTLVALPVLESVFPARLLAQAVPAAAAGKVFPKRLAFVYIPNGATMAAWTPEAVGTNFELPYTLAPLKDFQRDITILTGMNNNNANELGDGGGGHARASASYLTGVHPKKTAGADIRAGVSADQIAASRLGHLTKIPSLELSCDRGQRAGTCDSGYSCAYQFNVSWKSETQPMNPEVEPRLVFDRLFGDGSAESAEARARRDLYRKSVLDFVLDDVRCLAPNLDASDRRKLDEYLTAVREIELRVAQAEKFDAQLPPGAVRPDMAANFEEHARLMYDMQALAFQADVTRISTFIIGHDGSNRPYPQIGISDGHHDISHHRNDGEKKDQIAHINRYHVSLFADFLRKLQSVPEGDGTLLDNCMIVYGSGLSDGNSHRPENLPVVVAGHGGGALCGGLHWRSEELVPMTNLYRSLLDQMSVPTEKIGDSTGKLDGIFASA